MPVEREEASFGRLKPCVFEAGTQLGREPRRRRRGQSKNRIDGGNVRIGLLPGWPRYISATRTAEEGNVAIGITR